MGRFDLNPLKMSQFEEKNSIKHDLAYKYTNYSLFTVPTRNDATQDEKYGKFACT